MAPLVPQRRRQPSQANGSRVTRSRRQFLVYQANDDEQDPEAKSPAGDNPFLDDNDEGMNPFSDVQDDSATAVVEKARSKARTKAKSRITQDQTGLPKHSSGRSILASKSTNQQLRQPVPASKFEVVIPVKRPLPPPPPAKRTRLSSPTGSMAPPPPGTPKTVDRDMSKVLKRPQKNKFRHAKTDDVPAGLSLEVVPMGDVDTIIDPRKSPIITLDSPPPSPAKAWLKGKASGVVSGARKVADRLLKTGGHSKGYQPIDEEPSEGKPLRKERRISSSKLISTKKKLPHDSSGHFHRLEEVDSFGELVGDVSASSNSSNSFLLGKQEDELSLPNGKYIVNYTDSDTVVSRHEDKKETVELMSDSPLAQFTPMLGWKNKRKKGLRFFKEKSPPEEDSDATMSSANEIPGKSSLSTLKEIGEMSEGELSNSNHPVIQPALAKDKNPHPTTKKVVKKMGRAGVEKVYGKRNSKASDMAARDRRGWIPIEPGMNGHKEVVAIDD
ncbi:hypothetical protein K440DRAFT_257971 [Wilcoxina mikolae CBS 423.85]|nr:hypothetical protein K440DRAFT_257971 [Wilcoxina mikolae CBS 423.85]